MKSPEVLLDMTVSAIIFLRSLSVWKCFCHLSCILVLEDLPCFSKHLQMFFYIHILFTLRTIGSLKPTIGEMINLGRTLDSNPGDMY